MTMKSARQPSGSRSARRSLARRSALGGALVFALALTGTACSTGEKPASAPEATSESQIPLPEKIRESGVINVATFANYPPYTQMEGGKLTGIEPPLVEAIAAELGVEVKFNDLKFEAMIPSVMNGRNDVMIGMLADTAERREEVDFLDISSSRIQVMTQRGNPHDIDPTELCGTKIGESAGSYQEGVVRKISEQCEADGKPAIELLSFADPATNFMSLLSGRIEATLQDPGIAHYSVEQNPELEVLDEEVPLDEVELQGWIFRKGDDELIRAFALAIEELEKDGKWTGMLAEHGLADSALVPPTVNTQPFDAGS